MAGVFAAREAEAEAGGAVRALIEGQSHAQELIDQALLGVFETGPGVMAAGLHKVGYGAVHAAGLAQPGGSRRRQPVAGAMVMVGAIAARHMLV